MSWKQFDENRWINQSTGFWIYLEDDIASQTKLELYPPRESEPFTRFFDTREEAEAFIREWIGEEE